MPSLHVGFFMTLQVTIVNECCITYFTCKCLYSMWVATWLFSWQLWLNVRSHILHANGFTPCGLLHDSSSDSCGWMLDHIFHMQVASFPCGSLHDSSSANCGWMLHHMSHMQMPSLHVGLFMTLQVTTVDECCITNFTCKWLHSNVGRFMTLEVTTVHSEFAPYVP